jgi:hypothetical protein
MPGLAGRGCPRKADQVVGRLLTPRPQAGRDGGDAGGHRHVRHRRRGLIVEAVVCGQLVGQADAWRHGLVQPYCRECIDRGNADAG